MLLYFLDIFKGGKKNKEPSAIRERIGLCFAVINKSLLKDERALGDFMPDLNNQQ